MFDGRLVHHGRMGERWGWFAGGDRDDERAWFGGGTGGELSLTRDVAGPFRTEQGPCGVDRDVLRERFGVSDGLIDDVLAWWTDYQHRPVPTPDDWDYAHHELEDALWRRLRAEVPRGVFVCPADFVPRPVVVRMFVDDVSGIALWPGMVGWPPRPSFTVETLHLAADLRARVEVWVEEYTESIGGPYERFGEEWAVEHDIRGQALSRELQEELGEGYRVEYEPHSLAGREALFPNRVSLLNLGGDDLDRLPELPPPLRERVVAWLAELPRFGHVSDDEREEFFAWEDEGLLIRRELQGAWGVRVAYP